MSALDSLRQSLAATNAQTFRGLEFEHKALAQEIQKLKSWLGSNGTAKPPSNLIREALARFYQALKTESLRDTRLISYGFVDPFGDRAYRLIEDPQRFPKLMDCVDEYRGKTRAFRRCYKGLLNGYFTYDPETERAHEAGRQNWETLRGYLHDRISNLQGEGTLPEWVQTLIEHKNLATENPCARYGLSLLKNETHEFSEVQRKLEISDASWVTRRLILAQVDAATKESDGVFGDYITRLLDLLEKHQVVLNTGLGRVLTRYHRSTNPSLHPELRDFCVGHWGNPWLSSNSARWSLVPEATRAMVADWLKLEIIHQFFNLLAEDGSSDTRRLKFWQRYHKNIDDMYFGLGGRAATNRSRDFQELRKKMEGRVLGLYSAGPPENNAFIMCMGEYVVVEFGRKGNACFVFRRNALPFGLSGNVAGDGRELKHESHVERLLHINRSYDRWEDDFEKILYRLFGARPANQSELPAGVGAPSSRNPMPPATRVQRLIAPEPNVPYAPKVDPHYTRRELERFCAVRRIDVRDLTGVGGNLWVITYDSDEWIGRQLKAWGFAYKEGKGWWRKRAD